MWLVTAKNYVVDLTGLTRPELHVIIGLMIFGAAYFAFRRPWPAWAAVLGLELINEANDIVSLWVQQIPRHLIWAPLEDTAEDIFWTMLLPTLIAIAVSVLRRKTRVFIVLDQ